VTAVPTVLLDLTPLTQAGTRRRGIGRYIADLARAMSARPRTGTPPRLLALETLEFGAPPKVTDDLDGAVGRLMVLDQRRTHRQWAYRVRFRLAAAARRCQADMVHLLEPDATPIALRCRRVVTCHDLINVLFPAEYATWKEGWGPGRRWLDRRRYTTADHVIAVSETTAHDLVAELDVPAEKITVVRHGVDTARFTTCSGSSPDAVRSTYALQNRPYALYLGGGDWRKNPDGMLAALACAQRTQAGRDLLLVWAGSLDPKERRQAEALAERHGVGESVRFVGFVPDADIAPLMLGAVALLFVSRLEGFGYPLVEAMAAGCPIVAADRPWAREMAGDAAAFVDPDRPEAIAAALLDLARDSGARRALIDAGRARAPRFDLSRMADETLAVYRRVAGGAAA